MRVTRYDKVSSGMMAVVIALILVVLGIVAWWYATRPAPEPVLVPLVSIDDPGGFEDGAIDETLNVESPEEEIPNASPVDEAIDDQQIEEALDSVVELSDRATQQVQQVLSTDPQTGGTPGSHEGTGSRPLGSGDGTGGLPREQRWFISFSESGSIDVYARQLDYFGIELGAVFPAKQELVYLSNLTRNPPSKRVVTSTDAEARLYMSWQGGQRKAADAKLFERAGVDTQGGFILHFYPQKTEQQLARLERSYANRSVKEIRRTYFTVVPQGNGYSFAVTRQLYFR
ncbi:MAG: hypothetical protein DWQ34_10965 [Planctomycetota bacterium]|nr:MAG: hypothetical protein DWQ29_04150 [Planctomycetota bacterium]REJ93438.1 MAG: hypothetical protein DWQ34_10965 [Planctomycetota bacterium]REK25423.1 MAG: hypothetical protein DWQ41_12110 [Planctomycetota bacterium]REK38161.1 MAG: hypothetical protein DWQ45_05065 [Planctomycetota bacterium]